jgi:hypothetical protein
MKVKEIQGLVKEMTSSSSTDLRMRLWYDAVKNKDVSFDDFCTLAFYSVR